MSKIIEIAEYKFDVEDYNEGFNFLNFIFNNEKYYSVFTDSLLKEFLDMNSQEYAQKFNENKMVFGRAFVELRVVFDYFIKDLNSNNIFHHFLIESPVSDLVKKHQISEFLGGLMKIIEYYSQYEIESLDYYLVKNTIHDELKKKEWLVNFIPSFVIYIQLKNIYDILWGKYDLFIDKSKFSNRVVYSNKISVEKNKTYKSQSEGIEYYINNVSDKKEFLKELQIKFNTIKGKPFRILVELLKEERIVVIPYRGFKKFYNAAQTFFEQDIGSYPSIQNKYNHEDVVKYEKDSVESISRELTTIIRDYKV